MALALGEVREAEREVDARHAPAPEAVEDRAQARAQRSDPLHRQEVHEPQDEDAQLRAELAQDIHGAILPARFRPAARS